MTGPTTDRAPDAVRTPGDPTATTTEFRALPKPSGVAGLVGRATAMERANWVAIGRFVARRPRVPGGASGFSYDASSRPTLITILVVSVVEVVAVDLITHQGPGSASRCWCSGSGARCSWWACCWARSPDPMRWPGRDPAAKRR